jgi:hypothetical protein
VTGRGSVWALVGLWALACGGAPTRPGAAPARRTELVVEAAPGGLEQAVELDSSRWQPTAYLPDPAGGLEMDGAYTVRFRNRTGQALDLRCELRFYDADGFLVDVFIPFGQPLHLPPMGIQESSGPFTIRLAAGLDEGTAPVLMRVAARLALPP